jgi:hypothetical protein
MEISELIRGIILNIITGFVAYHLGLKRAQEEIMMQEKSRHRLHADTKMYDKKIAADEHLMLLVME